MTTDEHGNTIRGGPKHPRWQPHWTSTYEMPEDMPPKGQEYPQGRYRLADVVALGVCTWVNPLTGEECGWVHTCCTGHAKTKGNAPCAMPHRRGALVCGIHGGATRNSLNAAERRLMEAEIQGEVGRMLSEAEFETADVPLAEQLVTAVNRAGAMAAVYRRLLGRLEEDSAWSFQEVNTVTASTGDGPVSLSAGAPKRWVNVERLGLLGPNDKGVAVIHPIDEALHRWTKLHGELLLRAAALGLDERRQMFAEAQVAKIGDAITVLVAGLGLDLDDPTVVPVVEAALRVIAGDGPSSPVIEAGGAEMGLL